MFQKLKAWAKKMKKNLITLYLVLKRKDVRWYKKAFIGLVVSYAFSPIDLIPDFIPILGYLDDVILIPLGVYLSLKMIPKVILTECQEEAEKVTSKPKSIIFGVIIILLWMALITWMGFKIFNWIEK